MAELAAGAVVAEQVISTTIEGGVVAGYAVAKPTLPLKATFTQIHTANAEKSSSLARSYHTVSIISKKAFILGGQTSDGNLAGTDVYAVTVASKDKQHAEVQCIPAAPAEEGGELPQPRAKHAACSRNSRIYVFGGCNESGAPIEEGAKVWEFDEVKSTWLAHVPSTSEDLAPQPRHSHNLFAIDVDRLILYGGISSAGSPLSDTWIFHIPTGLWEPLIESPAPSTSAALVDNTLHIITGSDAMSSELHSLRLPSAANPDTNPVWETTSFPTNPLTPGPRPRTGAGLVPVTTGYGRLYLLYFFGAREGPQATSIDAKKGDAPPEQWSDIWTYQLPSAAPEVKASTSIKDAIKPAAIKDAIRKGLGYDSGGHSWAEVEVQAQEMTMHEGKVHPGPRGFFGADVLEDGRSVVMWGGVNAKGENEDDGWVIRLE